MEADEGRADLYERAVELLLARWENRLVRKESGQCTVDPGLIQRLGLRMDVVRGALGRVAFAAHERQGSDRGSSDRAADIPREDLREELGRELGSVDRADQVIAYIRDRAGLLHQLDNRTYAFAHRTFQEYLAARHLLSAAEPAAELGKRVRKDLTWWREVFLLAAGSAKRTTPSVITNLVNDLLPGPPPGNAVSSKKAEEAGLAGQALVETDFIDHVRREAEDRMPEDGPGSYASCLDKVQQWLLASLCADPTVAARERARAGATLAPLGDPRREVLDPDEMQFSLVHEVEVWLGSGDDDEMAFDDEKTKRKPRRYALGYGYWMARFPVTNAQFEHFVKDKGYGEARARYWIEAQAAGVWSGGEVEGRFDDLPRTAPSDYRSSFTLQNHPVVGITWYDALAIRAGSPSAGGRRGSSVRTRRSRCPPSPSGRRRRGGARDHPAGLPACAAEAGKKRAASPRSFQGPASTERATRATLSLGPLPRSEPGQLCRHGHRHDQRPWYLPRRGEPFGSEEMSGNVWEWTRSFWGDYPYPERPRDRKRRETLNASRDQGRALRGGGANADPGGVRCVARLVNAPFNHNWLIGFRVVVRPLL